MNNIECERLRLSRDNRMLRVSVGKHKGKWFASLDLWWVGWRLRKSRPRANNAFLYIIRRPVAESYTFTVSSMRDVIEHREFAKPDDKPYMLLNYLNYAGVDPVMVLVVRDGAYLYEALAVNRDRIVSYFDKNFYPGTPALLHIEKRKVDIEVLDVDDFIHKNDLKAFQLVDMP